MIRRFLTTTRLLSSAQQSSVEKFTIDTQVPRPFEAKDLSVKVKVDLNKEIPSDPRETLTIDITGDVTKPLAVHGSAGRRHGSKSSYSTHCTFQKKLQFEDVPVGTLPWSIVSANWVSGDRLLRLTLQQGKTSTQFEKRIPIAETSSSKTDTE